MKAGRRSLIAVLCPLLVFGLFLAVQGCGGEEDQTAADVEDQAEEVKDEAEDVTKEPAPEAEEVAYHVEGYTCPMHPAASSLTEGNCGTCGMKLEKANLYYTCTMCEGVHAHDPGKCSKCGMDLVLRPVPESPAPKPIH